MKNLFFVALIAIFLNSCVNSTTGSNVNKNNNSVAALTLPANIKILYKK